jgi:uncharacterized protein with beta-barrel porin domain
MPYAGVQSMQLDRDGFYEPGAAGFGLSAGKSRWRENQAIYGLRAERGWNVGSTRVSLRAYAEWQRVLSQSGSDIDAQFSDLDVWSPIAGDAFDGDARTFGFGVESRWYGGSLLSLSLDNRQESGSAYQGAMLRWSKSF